MPRLREVSCSIEWSETRAPFQEHGTVYGDSVVETYITVPKRPQAFTIQLRSHAFIYQGLSAVVFMDGKYQTNRNRVNLQPTSKDTGQEHMLVSFLMRQKEKPVGDGMYLGREWRFDDHNIMDAPADMQTDHFNDLSTIEVLVLRCRSRVPKDYPDSPCSSAADCDLFQELQDSKKPDKAEIRSESQRKPPDSPQISGIDGFGGLFDGPSDIHGSYSDRDRAYWPPNAQSSMSARLPANQDLKGNGYPMDRYPYHPASIPYTFYDTHAIPQQPKPKKHVHFDFGPYGPPPSVQGPREDPVGPRPGSYDRHRPQPGYPTATLNLDHVAMQQGQYRGAPASLSPRTSRAAHSEFERNTYYHAPQPFESSADAAICTQAPGSTPFYSPFPGSYINPYGHGYFLHPHNSQPSYVPQWHDPRHPFPDNVVQNWGSHVPLPYAAQSAFCHGPAPYHGHAAFSRPAHLEQLNGLGHVIPGSVSPQPADVTRTTDQQGHSLNEGADTVLRSNEAGASTDIDWQQKQSQDNENMNNGGNQTNWGVNNDTDWGANNDTNIDNETSNANINWDAGQNTDGDNTWNTENNNKSTGATSFQVTNENNEFAATDQHLPSDMQNNTRDNSQMLHSTSPPTRALYGPHGEYYTWDLRGEEHPLPDAEEEPRYDVPKNIADIRGSTKQVQTGKGYIYYKKGQSVDYIDSMEEPYARFVFKYRTKDQLSREIGVQIDTDPSGDLAIQELQNMDKQVLIESLLRAKSALGGKIPSPPLLSYSLAACGENSKNTPMPVDAPTYTYLRYSLPPARNPGIQSQPEKAMANHDWQQSNTVDTGNNNATQPDPAQDWSNPQESKLYPGITHIDSHSSNPDMVGNESKDPENPNSEQMVPNHSRKLQDDNPNSGELKDPFANVPSLQSSPVGNIPGLSHGRYQSSPLGLGNVSSQGQAPIAPAAPQNNFW